MESRRGHVQQGTLLLELQLNLLKTRVDGLGGLRLLFEDILKMGLGRMGPRGSLLFVELLLNGLERRQLAWSMGSSGKFWREPGGQGLSRF